MNYLSVWSRGGTLPQVNPVETGQYPPPTVEEIVASVGGVSAFASLAILKTFTTTSLETPYFIYVVQDNTLYGFALTAGTDAESLPWIVRPSDYAAGTNERFWKLVSLCSDHIKMANPTDSKFYPVQPVGDTIGVGDGESIT